MKKRALIVAGGTPPSDKLLKREVSRADLVIAADSGADPLVNMEIEALTLIGDFDSISPKVLETYRKKQVEILTSNTHKDETDTLLAMDAAIARGANARHGVGGVGEKIGPSIRQHCPFALRKEKRHHGRAERRYHMGFFGQEKHML